MREMPLAQSVIEIVEGTARQHSEAVPLSSLIEPCPRCGSHQLRVIGGNEPKVCEIEIH